MSGQVWSNLARIAADAGDKMAERRTWTRRSVNELPQAMIFEWDDARSLRNLQERRLPFEAAIALFDGPTLEIEDGRRDYGEVLIKAIGSVRDVILVCIYTDRQTSSGLVRRIISLRLAHRKERDGYRATYPS